MTTWNRKAGARTELCIRCGEREPASQKRKCKECLAELEADRRVRLLEIGGHDKPCAWSGGCVEPRFRLPSQYSSYCRAHHLQMLRKIRIKAEYGLSMEEYDALMEAAGHRCQICGSTVKLVIDHCHATGIVRGILCDPHNKGLGNFQDDTDALASGIAYLIAFQERLALTSAAKA